MARKEFSARIKAAALRRCMDERGVPRCEGRVYGHEEWQRCCALLKAGNIFYDHIRADGLGGSNDLSNCQCLCRTCHDKKTFTEDNPRMVKADNQRKRNFGIKARKGPPLPGTKASGLRKRMDGTVEKR